MKKIFIRILIAGLLALSIALAATQRPQGFYPMLEVEIADPALSPSGSSALSFLFDSQPEIKDCEAITGNIARAVLKKCPQCRIKNIQCENTLSDDQQTLFTDTPLNIASGRMANGVILFHAANPEHALSACLAAETQTAAGNNPVKCFAANTPRMKPAAHSILSPWALVLLLSAFSAAWFVGWLIVKYEHLHAHFSHDHADTGPQKYHTEPTPRIGGLMVMTGLLASLGIASFVDAAPIEREFCILLLAAIPAFLGGLVEDVTKKIGVLERLLLTMLSAAIAAWLLGITLQRLDLGGVYASLVSAVPLAAIIFTVFAVGGIANSINIIDGYNGLAGGFAIIVLVALAYVAALVGDNLVFTVALALAGALLGFLVWNWPGGKIFLGDGGSYLLGFLLAELSVILVTRNPEVSPWFPLLLLIYPVFETFFSIYRRKLKHGLSPGQPDNLHLHQLIHDNLVRRGERTCTNDTNHRVAKYLWIPAVATAVLACIFWQSTLTLVGFTIAYCFFYVVSYRRIARLKAVTAEFQKHKAT
ncbi:MAG: glycosyltransferase [Gallionella sp.]|nr:glycosyltransferase [Gallionella sp.]